MGARGSLPRAKPGSGDRPMPAKKENGSVTLAAERHGPGGPTGLQNRCGRATHGSVGSTPAPLRSRREGRSLGAAAGRGESGFEPRRALVEQRGEVVDAGRAADQVALRVRT